MITESETPGEHDAPRNIIPSVQVIQVPLGGHHTMNEPPLLWSPDLVSQARGERELSQSQVTEGRHFEGGREGAKTGGMIPCLVITAGLPGYLLILSKQSAPRVSSEPGKETPRS